jgi:glycosyltransferase involved in cell wall biosynthesis
MRFRFDVVYARHGVSSPIAILLAKLNRIPVILEVNALFEVEAQDSNWPSLSIYLAKLIENLFLPAADAIIAVTKEIKSEISHRFHLNGNKIYIVSNGVDTYLFRPKDMYLSRKQCNIEHAKNVVCFVGNFLAYQGIHNLIKCAPIVLKNFPETVFLLVGDGPLRTDLQHHVRSMNIDYAFNFVGKVSHSEVPKYINSANICVAPFTSSISRSGLSPLKLYEYMSCGKPVVGSNIPGLEDVLIKHECGLSVESDNPSSLAEGIIRLLGDNKLAITMGVNARKAAVEFYSWNAVAETVAKICSRIVSRTQNRSKTL